MKNKKQVQNEINKLRKIVGLDSSTEQEKHAAWCSMLALQWMYCKPGPISPSTICKPNLNKWDLK